MRLLPSVGTTTQRTATSGALPKINAAASPQNERGRAARSESGFLVQ